MVRHGGGNMQEWLRDKSLNILEWPSQSPDLNPIEHLWRELKIAVQQRSQSNLTELERICRGEWEKPPKYRCAKLVASYPRRLSEGSEYLCKFEISFLYLLLSCHYGVLCVD